MLLLGEELRVGVFEDDLNDHSHCEKQNRHVKDSDNFERTLFQDMGIKTIKVIAYSFERSAKK